MKPCVYHRPQTLDEALILARQHAGARFIAGGTDLLVQMRAGRHNPDALISLRSIPELSGVSVDETGVRIGAATPVVEILANEAINAWYPVLIGALRRLGSAQIRSTATIGGNLVNASPLADSAPPLIAVDATVSVAGKDGVRTGTIEDFFHGPGACDASRDEVVTEIALPMPHVDARGAFLRKERVHMDLALASVAIVLRMEGDICADIRIVAGAVAPVPLRLRETEAVLRGERVSERITAARSVAEAEVRPITDVRSTESYRRHIVGAFVRRGVLSLAGGAS